MTAVAEFVAAVSLARVVGMGLLAFALAGVVSLGYRTYLDDRIPLYVPLIVGVGAVGLWMNTASAIVAFVESSTAESPLVLEAVETNTAAIVAAVDGAVAGARVGDRLAPNLRALTGATAVETEVSRIVRTVGRFIAVKLRKAKNIEDIEGYEPVDDETKVALGGTELLFPRGLTVAELRRRFVARLREDYGVGYVDVELTEEVNVAYLA
ncbi:MAG: potassium transporter TrkA, partial [Halobacteriaceae archaeon]